MKDNPSDLSPLAKIILGGLVATGLALTLPMDLLLSVFIAGVVAPAMFLGAVLLALEGIYEMLRNLWRGDVGKDLHSRVSYYRQQFAKDPHFAQ